MDNKQGIRVVAIVVAAVLVLAIAYKVMTLPDHRSATDKLSDAIRDLPKGPDKAVDDLQDRTPGQKLGDKIKDWTAPQQ
jgi:hypothetical protein